MKKYIIVTYDVCNMGGGQLYVLRRSNHLKDLGYDVHIVVYYDSGYFPLKEQFEGFPIYLVPEIGNYTSQYSENRVSTIIDNLLTQIGAADSFYIESHTLSAAVWGEYISNKCGGKHLIYPLAEPLVRKYRFKPGKVFFNYKLEKGEMYGCSSLALNLMFERKVDSSNYINIGFDEKELIESCEPALPIKKKDYDYVITTVSRLDKVYIEPLIIETIRFARKYKDKKFALLVAGGSKTPGREDYLFSKYDNTNLDIPNLNIIFTGYIKLGKDLFEISDVFVGMGTASINAISQRCLTINIDPGFGMKYASGFFGLDTKNFAYSDNGKTYEISKKLEEAFLMSEPEQANAIEIGRRLFENMFEISHCFAQLDNVISSLRPSSSEQLLKVSSVYRLFTMFATKLILVYHHIRSIYFKNL